MNGLISKWRGDTLLLTPAAWIHSEASVPPLSAVRQLRRDERDGKGYLSLTALAAAAETLTAPQLRFLKGEFPILDGIAPVRELFAVGRRFPELFSTGGLRLTPELLILTRAQPGLAKSRLLNETPVVAARILETPQPSGGAAGRAIWIEFLTPAETWERVWNFTQIPQPSNRRAASPK